MKKKLPGVIFFFAWKYAFIIFLLVVFFSNYLYAQAPPIQWQKCLGGSSGDGAYSIQQTTDGGYIVAGYTSSNNGDVSGHHGSTFFSDYWVVKLDVSGNIQWQKCLGGGIDDFSYSIQQTADGGYVVAGYIFSIDGDISGNHGNDDFWVVKLDAAGNIQWQKCLGGSEYDYAFSIRQTTEGGFIVAGGSNSNDGDVSGNHGSDDFWIVKLDPVGNIQWQKCLGGSNLDYGASSIRQTTDGGYIVTGETYSNDGDVSGNHGTYDYWVVKLDASGNIQWQKCLGGGAWDKAYSIQQTTDGGYIVAGVTGSNDGDVSGNLGGNDFWVVKLGANGLPLRLLSFTGALENNTIKLNWQTTDEINTRDFIVERSTNGISFSAIGNVDADISPAINHFYNYTDIAPVPGNNFYRLKMEDIDYSFTYSPVVKIYYNRQGTFEITLAPNPVFSSTFVSFTIPQSLHVAVKIFDAYGKLIKVLADTKFEKGKYYLQWNTEGISAGTYFLHFDAGSYSDTKKLSVIK